MNIQSPVRMSTACAMYSKVQNFVELHVHFIVCMYIYMYSVFKFDIHVSVPGNVNSVFPCS